MTGVNKIEATVRQPYFQPVRLPIGDDRRGGLIADDFRIVSGPDASQDSREFLGMHHRGAAAC